MDGEGIWRRGDVLGRFACLLQSGFEGQARGSHQAKGLTGHHSLDPATSGFDPSLNGPQLGQGHDAIAAVQPDRASLVMAIEPGFHFIQRGGAAVGLAFEP